MSLALQTFFIEHTFVMSGAKRETRNLTMHTYKLRAHLRGLWPSILRYLHATVPTLSEGEGSLQDDMKLAVDQAAAPDFDEEVDETNRRAESMAHHAWKLAKKRAKRTGEVCLASVLDTAEVMT